MPLCSKMETQEKLPVLFPFELALSAPVAKVRVNCKQTLVHGCVHLCYICSALLHLFIKKLHPDRILSLHSQHAVKSLSLL